MSRNRRCPWSLMRQRMHGGKGILNEWETSVLVPIFKGKGDAMDWDSYRVKFLEHEMKIVERVLEKRIRALNRFG